MKTLDETTTVDDTVENQQICKKYCGSCPTYKAGQSFRNITGYTVLHPGKIFGYVKGKNGKLLLSGM